VIRVFKVSISLVRCTQFLTGGKFSGRGKVRSVSFSREISAIAAAKSNSVLLISWRSIISSHLLIPTALQISINVSHRIRFCAQNFLKVGFEVRAALHQVSSLLFHPRLRLTMSMIFSPSADAQSQPAIAIYTLLFLIDVILPCSSVVKKSARSLYQIRFKPVNGILPSPHLSANFSNL
jgi:hypothetical protein